jgi:hypothetical protein
MNDIYLTEQMVRAKLIELAKANGVVAPNTIVVEREQAPRSITRTVRIALVVPTGDESLIDKLVLATIDDDLDFWFIGSNINLQGDLEVEYLIFETKIMSKK